MNPHENLSLNKQDYSEVDQFFKTIGEVSAEIGIPPHVLRFWESKFFRIKPHKRKGGHRYYSKADIDIIYQIRKLLYDEGYTIKGAQKYLREKGYMQSNSAVNQPNLFLDENRSQSNNSTQELQMDRDRPVFQENIFNHPERKVEQPDHDAVKLLLKELESIKQILDKK